MGFFPALQNFASLVILYTDPCLSVRTIQPCTFEYYYEHVTPRDMTSLNIATNKKVKDKY